MNSLMWNTDWLASEIALEDAILTSIKGRKYSEPDDYKTAAESRERMNALLRDLGEGS